MNEKPHTHHCNHCGLDIDCITAREGGCIFQPSTGMTCGRCMEEKFGTGDPDDGEHRCQCPAPDPPVEGAQCETCFRWVVMFDPSRVFDLTRLGL